MRELFLAWRRLALWRGTGLVALVSLGVGCAAVLAVAAVFHHVLVADLPFANGDRLVAVTEVNADGRAMPMAGPNFVDLQARHGGIEALAGYGGDTSSVYFDSGTRKLGSYGVTPQFFETLGVVPQGRALTPDLDKAQVAWVSERVWREAFGNRAGFDGARLTVWDMTLDVVGVIPDRLAFPADAQVWFPMGLFGEQTSRTAHNLDAIGRLAAGVTPAQARSDADAIGRTLAQEHAGDIDLASFGIVGLKEDLGARAKPVLWTLLFAAALLLAAAAGNVANLALARHLARGHELAVRAALGAARSRLLRGALAEGLCLGLAAAVVGVVAALVTLRLFGSMVGTQLPGIADAALQLQTVLPCFALTVLLAIGAYALPMLRGRDDPAAGLAEGGARGGTSRASLRLRRVLLAVQIALATVLVAATLLLGRSFVGLLDVDPGFDASGNVMAEVVLPPEFATERRTQVYERIRESLETLPGVEAAGLTNALPLSGNGSNGQFLVEDGKNTTGYAEYRAVSAGYFAAMGMPLREGRDIATTDVNGQPHVAVISRRVARETFPNGDAIGQRIQYGNMDGDTTLITIVGVVDDVRERGLDRPASATVYVAAAQRAASVREPGFVVRGQGAAAALAQRVVQAVLAVEPAAQASVRPVASLIGDSLALRRFTLQLFAALCGAALALALVGIYSLAAYMVRERQRELAVRLSLGASPASIRRLVLLQGAATQIGGIVAGLVLFAAGAHWLSSLVTGIGVHDVSGYAITAAVLGSCVLLAGLIPARRATRVPPMAALRHV